jgi:hypothetical protein
VVVTVEGTDTGKGAADIKATKDAKDKTGLNDKGGRTATIENPSQVRSFLGLGAPLSEDSTVSAEATARSFIQPSERPDLFRRLMSAAKPSPPGTPAS